MSRKTTDLSLDIFNPLYLPKEQKKRNTVETVRTVGQFKAEKERPVWIGQNIYIRPSYIVSLPEYYGSSQYSSLDFQANQANLLDNSAKGLLSRKAVGNMKNAINWLLCSAEEKQVYHKKKDSWFTFKVGFMTLTVPDTVEKIDSKFLQTKLLHPFLVYCRKYFGLKNYVWKLEYQKNGNLHVHLAIDCFIHYALIRSTWNRILSNNSMIDEYQKKFSGCSFDKYCKMMPIYDTRNLEQKRKAWEHGNETFWRDPNTTDIHSVRKIRNMASYLAKYMAKGIGAFSDFKGRIWGCNYELSKANKTRIFLDPHSCIDDLKPLMQKNIQFKPIEIKNEMTQIPRQIGEIFLLEFKNWLTDITGPIKEAFDDTILMLKNVMSDEQNLFTV